MTTSVVDDRVANQTTEEWIKEYTNGNPVIPANNSESNKRASIPQLRFDHHRTTNYKTGCVALSFTNLVTNQECVAFFNCDLTRQRGPKKGENYRVGRGGQFLPPKRGKFRAFFLEANGKPPRRWAAVHKELKARFKDLTFTGEMIVGYTKDGKPFNKVKNIRVIEEQIGDNLGTTKEQFIDIPF